MSDSTNEDPTPDETAPSETATDESTPSETANDETAPGETANEESTPSETANDESTPSETANEDRGPCPHCGETIARIARKCRHCGEYRDSSTPVVDPTAGMAMSFGLGVVLVALTCVISGIGAALVGPSAARVRRQANETTAIESLRAIVAAEVAFKQKDLDGDGVKNFATLGQLGTSGQLQPDLASGLRDLYVFEVGVSSVAPKERWMATATPISPELSGARYFAVNHSGAVYYRAGRPFPLDLVFCELPTGAVPVGANFPHSR